MFLRATEPPRSLDSLWLRAGAEDSLAWRGIEPRIAILAAKRLHEKIDERPSPGGNMATCRQCHMKREADTAPPRQHTFEAARRVSRCAVASAAAGSGIDTGGASLPAPSRYSVSSRRSAATAGSTPSCCSNSSGVPGRPCRSR